MVPSSSPAASRGQRRSCHITGPSCSWTRWSLLASACGLLAGLLGATAEAAGPGHQGVIEEVVVTARKRPERLQDVPASLSVVDAEALGAMGAVQLDDVTLRLPNFASNGSPFTGFGARYVRGLNAGARNIGFDSGYAVFVDGIYSGRYITADRVLQDVARIEYLPGPQGTLFGRNTTLGVVNIVTAVPRSEPGARFDLGLGSDGERRGRGAVNGPVSGGWTATASAGRRERDGLLDNRYLGETGNNVEQWDTRAALHGAIGGWRTVIAADYAENTPDLIAYQRLEGLGALPPRVASNDLSGRLEDEDYGASVTLEREIALGTVTSLTALRSYRTDADADDDAWEVPVQHLLGWQENTDQISQELRLAGQAGAVDYLVGGYYLGQRAESERTVSSFLGQANARGAVDSRTWAVFSTVGRPLSDRLYGELGLRWSRESKDMPRYRQSGGGILLDVSTSDERTVSSVSPSASLRYAVGERTSIYARYAQGFKSGGFNLDLVTSPVLADPEFDDERVDSVELGVKSTLLDGRLRLAAAAFRSEYDDLQVSQYEVPPGAMLPTLSISNAASAHTQGVELSAELLLARWLLAASVGQNHSEVDDFPDPLGPGSGNYAGNSLGGPEWTSSLMAQYARPVAGWGDLTLTAEHLFQDALGGDLDGDRLSTSDSLSLVNLRAALAFGAGRQWEVRAWVDNAFDTERVVQRNRNAAPGLLMLIGYPAEIADSTVGLYNDPRSYGLGVALTF